MVIRELERTACFAWSKGSAQLLATGTKVGALGDDLSSETKLELWDLGLSKLDPPSDQKPIASITVDSGFNDISWSEPNDENPLGVIAGALENGSVDLWDAKKLHDGASDARISRTTKHSGPAKALQWNPHRHSLLASVGAKGEVFIYELHNMASPFRLGTNTARADDIECLDWNKQEKTAHILATGSSGGFVTVWDVKQKRDILTLNTQGRKAVSAVAWDPEESTKLATATSNDAEPSIMMWSLRNSSAPERTLKGHELGVLSLAWCIQDPELLLSCGKDNRTICWNPRTGERYGDFAVGSNWVFQTKWNPVNPNLIASASFDAKILITTTQNIEKKTAEQSQAAQSLDAAAFFATAQAQPQQINFAIPKAPKWLARPSNVSFGFGGKLVRVTTDASRKSKISISTFAADSSIGESAVKFQEKLKAGDMASICTEKIGDATTEEDKSDWRVIESLNAGQSRKKLREYLGFSVDSTDESQLNGNSDLKAKPNGDKSDDDFFSGADGDDFLANLASSKGVKTHSPYSFYTGSESDADKSITNALMLGQFDKALDICLDPSHDRLDDAFMIAVVGGPSCIEKTQAAYFKRKGKAGQGPNYLRLLASVVGKNLWDVVHNADLKHWKDVMATICTYAEGAEFSDLCEALGDRLEEAYQDSPSSKALRADASFCYLAGSKLEKVVNNWVEELSEKEKSTLAASTELNSFSVHARCLQEFVEKVSVFEKVTKFRDPQLSATEDWKLAPLYTKYAEYSDILTAHGQLAIAEQYLMLLPPKFGSAESAQQRIGLSTRSASAAAQRQPAAAQRASAMLPTPAQPAAPAVSAPQPLINQARNAPSPYAPMQPVAPGPSGAYAPQNPLVPANSGYTPAGYQPQTAPNAYGQSPYGAAPIAPPQAAVPPPPRAGTASPSVASGTLKPAGDWNDMPANFLKDRQPNSRRGTPGPQPVSSPFPNAQAAFQTSPPQSGYGQPRPAPLGPPPKAGEMAQRMASPPNVPSASPDGRPPSNRGYAPAGGLVSSPYSPAQPPLGSTLPTPTVPPVARGASPYQPPPSTSTAPASNRYAPAPGSQPSQAAGPPHQRQVAPNPYGAQNQASYGQPPVAQQMPYGQPPPPQQAAPQAVGPPPRAGPPPSGPPRAQPAAPVAPPPSGPARHVPPPASSAAPLPQSAADAKADATPAAASGATKYPRGDRSHIPANARVIVDRLEPEVARIKAVAPATFKPQVDDMEKRVNILFDHLNNQDLLSDVTVATMVQLTEAVEARDWERASALFNDMQRERPQEGGVWTVGIKRLIAFGRATK